MNNKSKFQSKCSECNGAGTVIEDYVTLGGQPCACQVVCDTCHGKGNLSRDIPERDNSMSRNKIVTENND
jgi:DnaJ-class molecular chaperone